MRVRVTRYDPDITALQRVQELLSFWYNLKDILSIDAECTYKGEHYPGEREETIWHLFPVSPKFWEKSLSKMLPRGFDCDMEFFPFLVIRGDFEVSGGENEEDARKENVVRLYMKMTWEEFSAFRDEDFKELMEVGVVSR